MSVTPSEEQNEIINAIGDGSNLIINAVAGSGKTTTTLLLAKQYPQKKFLLFTYNSRLKAETRQRVKKLGLQNLEVHSYHSFGLTYYTNPCVTDLDLGNIIHRNIPIHNKPSPDIVIMDETQDMTKPYFDFVHKAVTDIQNPSLQFVILGDEMQCIYDFPQKGADFRFLTLADKLFESPLPWRRLHLKTSYRITKNMEYFVNSAVLNYPRMKSVKEHPVPVTYITGDQFKKVPEYIVQQILGLLKIYKPQDIFILAPSIRSLNDMNPVKKLENTLVRAGIPVYAPMSDDADLKDEVLEGKVVFSSLHQSKGLERKIVFLLSFNDSYFTYFAKDKDRSICPNTLYVGITRAMERLYVCGENPGRDRPCRFLNTYLLNNSGGRIQKINLSSSDSTDSSPERSPLAESKLLRRVTELTRFIPDQLQSQILELCQMETVTPVYTSTDMPNIICTGGGRKEEVSDLNGIAIPAYYEHKLKGTMSIQEDLKDFFIRKIDDSNTQKSQLKKYIKTIVNEPKVPSEYLTLANIYSAYISGFMYKMEQITDYTWLSEETLGNLVNILTKAVGPQTAKTEFEYTLDEESYQFHDKELQIQGRADMIDRKCLWEFKCVDSLKAEHIVQLALYAWLWQRTEYNVKGARRFLLHNIRTGEVLELKGVQNLNYVADMILDNHFRTAVILTDEQFIESCKKQTTSYTKATVSVNRCMFEDD